MCVCINYNAVFFFINYVITIYAREQEIKILKYLWCIRFIIFLFLFYFYDDFEAIYSVVFKYYMSCN